MKYFKHITFPLFLLLTLATACVREIAEDAPADGLKLTLNIPGATVSKASGNELAGESSIYNVYLLFYPKEGSDDTTLPVFFYKETGLTDKEIHWSHQFGEVHLAALEAGTAYDVFAFASLPDATTAPTKTTTKGALMALTEQQFERSVETPGISFTGKGSYTGGTAANLDIDLVRTVARIDITLVNAPQSLEGIVDNEPLTTFYQPDRGMTADKRTTQPLFKTGTDTYRCYVYENAADEAPVRVQFMSTNDVGGDLAYSVEVNAGTGKNEIKRNYIYRLTLTFRDEGSLDVAMEDPINWSDETEVTPAIPDGIQVQPKANSYIVAPGGETLYIPVAQVNDANAFYSVIPSLSATEQLTADLIWTDVKGATSGLGVAEDASIAKIGVIGVGQDAVLSVKPGSQPGNSVVAVRNQYGQIKWSWHIWVTDYNPETDETGQHQVNGFVIMDRNLGAMSATLSATNASGVVGNYYQWGRKDPFPTINTAMNASITVYDAKGAAVTRGSLATVQRDMGKLVQAPFSYAANANYLDADYQVSSRMWNDDGLKTPLDPCPAGWRVPVESVLKDITATLAPAVADANNASAGRGSEIKGYYPYSKRMHANNGTIENYNMAFLWTASLGAGNTTVATGPQDFNFVQPYISYGYPVRCVRDQMVKAVDEIRVLAAGYCVPSLGNQIGPVAPASQFVDGLPLVLQRNFGKGKKVDSRFKFYNYYNNGVSQPASIGMDYGFCGVAPLTAADNGEGGKASENLLLKYDIDVLYLPYNSGGSGGPTKKQTEAILAWLAADAKRVLIFNLDIPLLFNNLTDALGIKQDYMFPAAGGNWQLLSYQPTTDLPEALALKQQEFVNGTYGRLGELLSVNSSAALERQPLIDNGYVPVISCKPKDGNVGGVPYTNDVVFVAVHPEKRVIILADTQFMQQGGSAAGLPFNPDGTENETYKGQYTLLNCNLWAWIVKQVKGH